MATQISFYHLTKSALEKSLPKLLEKALLAKHRLIVRVQDKILLDSLDNLLWTYTTKFFLPHGRANDNYAYMHPVILTTEITNPNKAGILTLIGNVNNSDVASFEKCLYLFDGNNEAELQFARNAWREFKNANHELKYWQQEDNGSWRTREV